MFEIFRRRRRAAARHRTRLARNTMSLQPLETRIMLDAQFAFGGSTLTLNQFTEVDTEGVRLSQADDGALIVELAEGVFSGSEGSGATLTSPSTLRLSPAAVDGMTSININDGAVGAGADPNVTIGDLELEDVALAVNGGGNFSSEAGAEALLDAVMATVDEATIDGLIGIDDDESLAIQTESAFDIGRDGQLASDGATIDLTAGGPFGGEGVISSQPQIGDGGNIKIATEAGATFAGTIDASGAHGQRATEETGATVGGSGGTITISQRAAATAALQIGIVRSNGGDGGVDASDRGRSSGAGGDGGNISITVNGGRDLEAELVESIGGVGGRRTGATGNASAGGTAGNINITAGSVIATRLRANGGIGGTAVTGGNSGKGGDGGSINVSASNQGGRSINVRAVETSAGRGGRAIGDGNGGNGGDAGNISMTANQASLVLGNVFAHGGRGGSADSGNGGNGGSGNSVSLSSAIALYVNKLQVIGGVGGTSQSGSGGNGGSGGNATVTGTRRVDIRELRTFGGRGAAGSTGGDGGDAGNANITATAVRAIVLLEFANANGGTAANNGGDGGTLTFNADREDLGTLMIDGGRGINGNDGDEGSVQ